jgi:hypothetical protein
MPRGSKTIDLIVRRGALRRFHKLKEKTADLPVNVTWDRRESDRRGDAGHVPANRRKADRRQRPPFTWEVGDFVVVPKGRRRKAR